MSTAPQGVAARDPMATIAALHQALRAMPDNVDAMVALGGLYLRIGRLDDGAQWCQQALARKPDHAPALKVLRAIGDAYVETGMRVAITGDLATVIDIYARADACRHPDARHYGALFRQAQDWLEAAKRVPRVENSVRISVAVWGNAYVRAAEKLFRSLLAPGNIPALAARGPVYLELTIGAGDRDVLDSLPVLAALRKFAKIEYFTIDPLVLSYDRARLSGFHYWIIAAVNYALIARCRHGGSHASIMSADSLFADGSLAAARRHIDAGRAAVMYTGLEVELASFMAALNDSGGDALSIAPRAMIGLALRHLHPDTRRLILEPGKAVPASVPHPAIFPIADGIVQHGFHLAPLLMSAELTGRAFTPDFLTSDTRMTRLALGDDDPRARLHVCADSDEIACVSAGRETPSAAFSSALNPDAMGKWGARWCFAPEDLPYFEWSFRQRRALRGPEAVGDVPPPSAFETETVEAALSAFRHHAMARTGRG